MSKQTLSYRGYEGSVEPSLEARVLHGKILFIRDMITYEGDDIPSLEQAFHEAVDEYLADCESLGVDPNKPYSGTFNIRIGAPRHQVLAKLGYKTGESINELICRAVDGLLKHDGQPRVTHVNHIAVYTQDIPSDTTKSRWDVKMAPNVALLPLRVAH